MIYTHDLPTNAIPKRLGKSVYHRKMMELLLDQGKKVMVYNREGSLIYQRHGHLTSITPCR